MMFTIKEVHRICELDLNSYVSQYKNANFYVKVSKDSLYNTFIISVGENNTKQLFNYSLKAEELLLDEHYLQFRKILREIIPRLVDQIINNLFDVNKPKISINIKTNAKDLKTIENYGIF